MKDKKTQVDISWIWGFAVIYLVSCTKVCFWKKKNVCVPSSSSKERLEPETSDAEMNQGVPEGCFCWLAVAYALKNSQPLSGVHFLKLPDLSNQINCKHHSPSVSLTICYHLCLLWFWSMKASTFELCIYNSYLLSYYLRVPFPGCCGIN